MRHHRPFHCVNNANIAAQYLRYLVYHQEQRIALGSLRSLSFTPWNLVSYIPWISYIHGISYMHGISSYMHGISSYMHGISSYILWHIILHTMANRM